MIGERLKHVFAGYHVWILSYKDECFDKIGLRPKEKLKLMNGSLECEYRCYEMFDGKNKDYKKAINEDGEQKRLERDNKKPVEKRPANFKTDRPDRRFAAAHSNDGEKKLLKRKRDTLND
jgi:putative N6-adenine-specific DNA methylase